MEKSEGIHPHIENDQQFVNKEKPNFIYSPENPPPLEVLESKVFAVHATSTLPKDGILIAGARNFYDLKAEEPPSFRPTIHFSLGELVQNHSAGMAADFSWDDKPYAVVLPIKNIESQLVNIFPNDSFILGNLHLQEGMTLLVPKGTKLESRQGFEIKEYTKEVGLRKAVDDLILEKQGWHIKMKSGEVGLGQKAYVEGIEINNSKFFQSLFEKYPYISFGDSLESEKGDAFRFGQIEQIINWTMKGYTDHGPIFSTAEIYFSRLLIRHHLQKLEETIKKTPITPESFSVFEEKKIRLRGWLNIIDCDLNLRENKNATIIRAPESIQKIVRKKRNDPEKLTKILNRKILKLPFIYGKDEDGLSPRDLAQELFVMPVPELKQFMDDNKEFFQNFNLSEFFSGYAIKRWMMVRNEQAKNEGLDRLLENSIEQLPQQQNGNLDSFFKDLQSCLNEESSRQDTALTILDNPIVKKYLAEKEKYNEKLTKSKDFKPLEDLF